SINREGSLTIEVEKLMNESYLTQVIDMVRESQRTKSKTQDVTNKAAKWLFYIALAAGIITFIVWISIGATIDTAIMRLVTVLVIACPHALGLAAPLVISVYTSLARKNRRIIRKSLHIYKVSTTNAVIYDKTGTLNKDKFGVSDIQTINNSDVNILLSYAATIENDSHHPIARGILNEAKLK